MTREAKDRYADEFDRYLESTEPELYWKSWTIDDTPDMHWRSITLWDGKAGGPACTLEMSIDWEDHPPAVHIEHPDPSRLEDAEAEMVRAMADEATMIGVQILARGPAAP